MSTPVWRTECSAPWTRGSPAQEVLMSSLRTPEIIKDFKPATPGLAPSYHRAMRSPGHPSLLLSVWPLLPPLSEQPLNTRLRARWRREGWLGRKRGDGESPSPPGHVCEGGCGSCAVPQANAVPAPGDGLGTCHPSPAAGVHQGAAAGVRRAGDILFSSPGQ